MSNIKSLKKDELKLVAEELGLNIPSGAKVIDLKNLIENSDIYTKDFEFVQSVIDNILDDKKLQSEREKSENEIKLELEKIKLSQVQAELELANLRKEAPKALNSEADSSSQNIENLIKSVKTLTIAIPTKAESFNLFFQSIEKAFRTKKVPEDLKAEILLNILGEKVTNLMVCIKDVNDYSNLNSIILKEFQSSLGLAALLYFL